MLRRFTLQQQFFLSLVVLVSAALIIVWTIVRPAYEASVIKERSTIVQQLQTYTVARLESSLDRWITVVQGVTSGLKADPSGSSALLRTATALNDDIIMIRVSSPGRPEALVSRNRSYPEIGTLPEPALRFHPHDDSSVTIGWVPDTGPAGAVFVLAQRFALGRQVFDCSVVVSASGFASTAFSGIGGVEASTAVRSGSGLLFANDIPFDAGPADLLSGTVTSMLETDRSDRSWVVLTSAFGRVPLSLTTAIPEAVVTEPVRDLLWSSSLLIVGSGVVLLSIGWIATRRLTGPLARLVEDVLPMESLDFTRPVRPPDLPDLAAVGRLLEGVRTTLGRYQRINVERIIFEEWKNKFLMTHSEDLMGITDGGGEFVFRNTGLEELWGSLGGGIALRTKDDILRHPKVRTVRQSTENDEQGPFRVSYAQTEIVVDLPDRASSHYRVQDVSIRRDLEDFGSLLVFHDLSRERELDQMKTDMINIIVHELRNPVGAISGFAEILLTHTKIPDNERTDIYTMISEGSKNLMSLINRFLDIQRLEAGKIDYPMERVDIAAMVREVLSAQAPYLREKSLRADLQLHQDLPAALVAPALMREAFTNLVSNAVKYGDPGRTIEVRLTSDNGHMALSVTDHGFGIPAEARDKLFTKFYQVKQNKRAGIKSSGLGLAYVKEIMNFHKGSISLESTPEIGSRFTLRFPVESPGTVA